MSARIVFIVEGSLSWKKIGETSNIRTAPFFSRQTTVMKIYISNNEMIQRDNYRGIKIFEMSVFIFDERKREREREFNRVYTVLAIERCT